jgi:hypothetical protein
MTTNKDKNTKLAFGILATVGAAGIATYACYRLRKKYTVFSEQRVSLLKCVDPQKLSQFHLQDKSYHSSNRIRRAEEVYGSDKEVSAFLAFTAFELHLRSIDQLIHPESKGDKGLKNLAGRLQSRKIISKDIREKIDNYIFEIRNPTMHCKPFYCFDKLKESIHFISQFIADHPISRYSTT